MSLGLIFGAKGSMTRMQCIGLYVRVGCPSFHLLSSVSQWAFMISLFPFTIISDMYREQTSNLLHRLLSSPIRYL